MTTVTVGRIRGLFADAQKGFTVFFRSKFSRLKATIGMGAITKGLLCRTSASTPEVLLADFKNFSFRLASCDVSFGHDVKLQYLRNGVVVNQLYLSKRELDVAG
jgi:hypothetical protein